MARIGVSPNGRHFVDESGAPFFWLGDTQWELFRRFTTDDAAEVLRRRKQQGFTVFHVMVTGVGEKNLPNVAGEAPWLNDDPSTPNDAYFSHVDEVVEAARDLDVILVPGVYHQVQRASLTTANARPYARWVAERYADVPNIIWATYPEAKADYIPVLREVAAGLREGDGGAHMISVHPDPSPTSSSFIHSEEWLDFNTIQTCLDLHLVYPMVAADYARTPAKPVVMAEGGYEGIEFGKRISPLIVRQQAYWTCLAGGYHSYGHDDNWESPATWRSWIGSPGARHMGVCRQVLTSLPGWWDRVPDQSVFAEGAGEGVGLNVAARSSARDWALAYLSSSTAVSVKMAGITAGGSSEASWIDPTSGERTRIGSFANSGRRSFSTPDGWEDALLLFERQRSA